MLEGGAALSRSLTPTSAIASLVRSETNPRNSGVARSSSYAARLLLRARRHAPVPHHRALCGMSSSLSNRPSRHSCGSQCTVGEDAPSNCKLNPAEPMQILQTQTMYPQSRLVHAGCVLFSCICAGMLAVCLASDRSVFTVEESYHGQLTAALGNLGYDHRYGVGLVSDTLGYGWGADLSLLGLDGCSEHAAKGTAAQWLVIVAETLMCLSVIGHVVGMLHDSRFARGFLAFLSGVCAVLCGFAVWVLIDLHESALPCTKLRVEGGVQVQDVQKASLGDFFARGFAYPALITVTVMSALLAVVALVSVFYCVRQKNVDLGFSKQKTDFDAMPSPTESEMREVDMSDMCADADVV